MLEYDDYRRYVLKGGCDIRDFIVFNDEDNVCKKKGLIFFEKLYFYTIERLIFAIFCKIVLHNEFKMGFSKAIYKGMKKRAKEKKKIQKYKNKQFSEN